MTDDQRARELIEDWLASLDIPTMRKSNVAGLICAVQTLAKEIRTDERERCAKVADDHDCSSYTEACVCTWHIAQRIREGTP